MSSFFIQININLVLTLILVISSLALLISSVFVALKFNKILISNKFSSKKWIIVIVLIFFFIFLYIISIFNIFKSPIKVKPLMSLIYFFGALFVFITMRSTYSMVKIIFGGDILNDKAIDIFLEITKFQKEELPHLFDTFIINCKYCNCDISYNVASVVKQHSSLNDKGIKIESIFGLKSIVLRPNHKCNNDLREIVVIHDNLLAFRSIDQTRILLN